MSNNTITTITINGKEVEVKDVTRLTKEGLHAYLTQVFNVSLTDTEVKKMSKDQLLKMVLDITAASVVMDDVSEDVNIGSVQELNELNKGEEIIMSNENVKVAEVAPEVKAEVVVDYAAVVGGFITVKQYFKNLSNGRYVRPVKYEVISNRPVVAAMEKFGAGKDDVRRIQMAAETLFNVKLYQKVSMEEVTEGIAAWTKKAEENKKDFRLDVIINESGRRVFVVVNNKTQEVSSVELPKDMMNALYHNKPVQKTAPAASVQAKVVSYAKCDCCGAETVTSANVQFLAQKDVQEAMPTNLKGKKMCMKCQKQHGVLAQYKAYWRAVNAQKQAQ